jgi:O-antigen ligase
MSLPFITVFMTSGELYNGILTAKMFYFYAVTVLLLLSIAFWLVFKKKSITITLSLLDILILLYLGYNFLRLLTTDYSSLQDYYFIWLVLLTALYFLWKYFISFDGNDKLNKPSIILFTVFLLAGLLQALYGIMQLYDISPGIVSNKFKVIGTLGNPDYFAGYLVSVAPFALGFYLLSKSNKTFNKPFTIIALITFLSCIFVLPSTLSRTSWLACGAGIVFIFWYKYHFTEKLKTIFNTQIKMVSIVVMSLIISLVIIASLYQIKPESAFGRLLLWKVSLNMIEENPFMGVGFNKFDVAYNNYQAEYFANGNGNNAERLLADNVRHAHNEYLQIGAEIGLIGLLIFLGIVGTAFKAPSSNDKTNSNKTLTEKNIINISTKAALIALLVFAFFSFPFHILPTLINFTFLLAVISKTNNPYFVKKITLGPSVIKPAAIIIIASVSIFTINNLQLYNAYYKWSDAFIAAKIGYFESAKNEYARLFPVLKNNGEFLFFYGASLSAVGNYNEAIKFLEPAKQNFSDPNLYITLGQSYARLNDFTKAENNLIHACNITPYKLFPKYLLAKLYYNHNMTENALDKANEIIHLNTKIKTTAADEIKTEMKVLIEKINASPVKAGM